MLSPVLSDHPLHVRMLVIDALGGVALEPLTLRLDPKIVGDAELIGNPVVSTIGQEGAFSLAGLQVRGPPGLYSVQGQV